MFEKTIVYVYTTYNDKNTKHTTLINIYQSPMYQNKSFIKIDTIFSSFYTVKY